MDQELSLVLLDSPKGAKNEQNLNASIPSTHRLRTFVKFFVYFSLVSLAYYFIISSFAVSPISPTLPESASGNEMDPINQKPRHDLATKPTSNRIYYRTETGYLHKKEKKLRFTRNLPKREFRQNFLF